MEEAGCVVEPKAVLRDGLDVLLVEVNEDDGEPCCTASNSAA